MKNLIGLSLFTLLLFSAAIAGAAPLIVNEYNAVGPTDFLKNDSSDVFFGTVAGNGGDWFELVVIEDHLNIQGWRIDLFEGGPNVDDELLFTDHAVWSDLRSGTIITVAEDTIEGLAGGPGDPLSYDPADPAATDWWINIQANTEADGTFITASNIRISSTDTRIELFDAAGASIFGPAGESITPVDGVGGTEVWKLEDDPSDAVTAASNYNDGSSSTFGQPNVFGGGQQMQDFSALRGGSPSLSPIQLNGGGQSYTENFDSLGNVGSPLPTGWSTVNDGATNLTVTADITNETVVAGSYNAGIGDDRTLANGHTADAQQSSFALSAEITDKQLRAYRLTFDLEAWQGDAAADTPGQAFVNTNISFVDGDGVEITASDLGVTSTDLTLAPGPIDGNDSANRASFDSGILELSAPIPAGSTLELSFDVAEGGANIGYVYGLDNVSLRALAAGDAQADGDIDPGDLIQLLAGGAFGQGNIDASWAQGDFDNDGDFDGTDILSVVQTLAGEFPKTYAHDPNNDVPDVLINPATGNITLDTNGITIGSIVMDSAAGIFNGPNSPSWDAPGDFAADIDTQISMPISFTNPGYTGVDDLGDGIIGDLAPGFDILADLTIKYLDPNGDLLDAEAHVVPEPSSIVLAVCGLLGLFGYTWRRRRLS